MAETLQWRLSQFGQVHHSKEGIIEGSKVICDMNESHPSYHDNVKLVLAAKEMSEALLAARAIFDSLGINENHRIVGEQYLKITNAISKAGV